MAHDDKKWTKGMTPAQKKKFEKKDEKNDAKLAKKIKKKQSLGPREGAFCFIIEGIPCGNQCFTRASKYAY